MTHHKGARRGGSIRGQKSVSYYISIPSFEDFCNLTFIRLCTKSIIKFVNLLFKTWICIKFLINKQNIKFGYGGIRDCNKKKIMAILYRYNLSIYHLRRQSISSDESQKFGMLTSKFKFNVKLNL